MVGFFSPSRGSCKKLSHGSSIQLHPASQTHWQLEIPRKPTLNPTRELFTQASCGIRPTFSQWSSKAGCHYHSGLLQNVSDGKPQTKKGNAECLLLLISCWFQAPPTPTACSSSILCQGNLINPHLMTFLRMTENTCSPVSSSGRHLSFLKNVW